MTGIILIAFGRRGYALAAHNLAVSLKHYSPKIPITLIADETCLKHLNGAMGLYDNVVVLQDEDIRTEGKIDPAKVKTDFYKYLPYENNLYLDVDALCLKDITPFIQELEKADGFYLTDVLGKGGKNDKINYNIWATNADSWEHFKLKEDAVFPAIQSSWAFIRKNKQADKFFAQLKKNYDKGFDKKRLTMNWGGTLPDELFYSATCAQLGVDPSFHVKPIFFGWARNRTKIPEVQSGFYFLSVYGNGIGKALVQLVYREWYDRLVIGLAKKTGIKTVKLPHIMQDKHANNK